MENTTCLQVAGADQQLVYVEKLHSTSKGYIALSQVRGSAYKQKLYKYDKLILQDMNGNNKYLSINSFKRKNRRIESLKELRALYIDIDVYKTSFSKEQIIMAFNMDYCRRLVPEPSFIIDSGRGLYMIWLLEDEKADKLPLWKSLEDSFYETLKELGADKKALDASRILRIPESINSKNNKLVKIVENNNIKYSLEEIKEEYFPELKLKQEKRGRPTRKVYIYRERSLYYQRLIDLYKLCELREWNMTGYRELVLFLYRYYSCYFSNDVEKAREDILELNKQFTKPLAEREVLSATRSAETSYTKKKKYKYKNITLIELFNITDAEQRELSTIIAYGEKKRRYRSRYKAELEEQGEKLKKDKLQDLYKKIITLREQGYKNKDICIQLDIPLKTLERYITKLRKDKLI